MSSRTVLSEAERAAALSEPPPRVPRTALGWIVGACLVLGLGGLVVDHFFGGAGSSSASSAPPGTNPPALRTFAPAAGAPGGHLGASAAAIMSLQPTAPTEAPRFSLTGIGGRPLTLEGFLGKVVVLTFFDARCDDICPVLEREMIEASAHLAAKGDATRVEFLTINTDPLATSLAATSPATRHMAGMKNWEYLTGTIGRLDPVWKAYGITIDVQPSTAAISHSDLMYFIDASGRLRAQATPFANQVAKGSFVLDRTTTARFGAGIAGEVEKLLTGPAHSS
ncbi:MAG: SCO family protein [Acidimicrobiales bacterium]